LERGSDQEVYIINNRRGGEKKKGVGIERLREEIKNS